MIEVKVNSEQVQVALQEALSKTDNLVYWIIVYSNLVQGCRLTTCFNYTIFLG